VLHLPPPAASGYNPVRHLRISQLPPSQDDMDDGNGLPIRNASLEDVHILASSAHFQVALGTASSGIPANRMA
jgi:hypothetical protein